MNFLERFHCAINGEKPDKVPILGYKGLFPHGAFERYLRNRGLGLISYANLVSETVENEKNCYANFGEHTEVTRSIPGGMVTNRFISGAAEARIVEAVHRLYTDSWIKRPEDYDVLISLIEQSSFSVNLTSFKERLADLGTDGYMLEGTAPAYTGLLSFLGVLCWTFEQVENPDRFNDLVNAYRRRSEKKVDILCSIDEIKMIMLGDITDNMGPNRLKEGDMPFWKKNVPILQKAGKKCGIHAHASILRPHLSNLSEMGLDFIESFTPPPYSDLPLPELRQSVGDSVCIYINIPEAVFYSGYDYTKKYTVELLQSDPSYRKAIGITEMGMMGVTEKTRNIFEEGFRAVFDAVDECS